MKLVIFEDGNYRQLFPVSILRPTFELRCGATSLRERILRRINCSEVVYFFRDELAGVFSGTLGGKVNDLGALRGDDVMLVNGRWLVQDEAPQVGGAEEVRFCGDTLVYAFARAETVENCRAESIGALLDALKSSLPNVRCEATIIEYPWDLVHHNSSAIVADFKAFGKSGIEGKFSEHAAI